MGEKYFRKKIRLQHYDYSDSGFYFITICINKMQNEFGKIKNGKMFLNNFGEIVEHMWEQIPTHYKNVKLDYYQIMPNHIHGIIIINNIRSDKCKSTTEFNKQHCWFV